MLDNYRAKWAYNTLNARQQKVYERLYNAAEASSRADVSVEDLGVNTDDVNIAYWAFDYDNPQFLQLGSGYMIKAYENDKAHPVFVSIDYGRTAGQVSQASFERAANNIIAQASQMPTDYEKLLYIHDWLVNNTVYSFNGAQYDYEADGPLVYGRGVCEGYSKAFMYLAQSMGFECVCAVGSGKGVDHMWNKVKLYGEWYNVDVTWDDPIRSNGANSLRYDYFLISDYEISGDHRVDNFFPLPAAYNSYRY